MKLKGKGFVLRQVRLSDAGEIYDGQREKEVRKAMISTPKSIREVEKEIRKDIIDRNRSKNKRDGEEWVIEIDGVVGGQISFYFHDKRNKTKAVLSYWIAKKYRGKGIMTAVLKKVTDYAFKNYNLVRLQGNVRTFNVASAKVLKKCGYKMEGILRKNNFKEGKYLDDMIWAKVR